jgi:hypothetical protein
VFRDTQYPDPACRAFQVWVFNPKDNNFNSTVKEERLKLAQLQQETARRQPWASAARSDMLERFVGPLSKNNYGKILETDLRRQLDQERAS